jgi:ankyrin repeat protein
MTPAHAIVAQACLGFLLHFDENITNDSLTNLNFPLAAYASARWVDHARFENVWPKVQDGIKRLFDPTKSHLSVWVWIYDPESPWRSLRRSEYPWEARATPLHYAAVCNMHGIATFLIVEHSQDVNALGFECEETPLHVSSRLGHVEITQVLLKHGADTEVRDKQNFSPLERVAYWGFVEVAQVLLEHGADANAQDNEGFAPLYRALYWEDHWQGVAQVLLSHGADVTAQYEDNQTPLHLAADEEVARLLLERGVDASALDINNRTPLHIVSGRRFGGVGAAWVLLEHGVDANARDANNDTPLHLLCGSHIRDEETLDIAWLLLQYGADIHARDGEGRTPFMRATAEYERKMMQLLLEHGAEDHRV